MDGGADNDRLEAGDGDDTLIGGTGDDYLYGYGYNNGNDTYVFSGNYGNDIIHDYDWNTSKERHQDTIRFSDVNVADVQVLLRGNDLVLKTSETNSVTIQNFQSGTAYHTEKFEFADKTLSLDELLASSVVYGSNANDTLNAFSDWKKSVNVLMLMVMRATTPSPLVWPMTV